MFIRRTQTRTRTSGQPYTTHRLVQSVRVGSVVKLSTLLNLGSHFDLPKEEWPALARRIDELLQGHAPCSMQRCPRRPRLWRSAMRRS